MGNETLSRRAMTLGFEEMKRPGDMLVLKEWRRGFVVREWMHNIDFNKTGVA